MNKTIGAVAVIVLVVIVATAVVLIPKAPGGAAMRLSSDAFEGDKIPAKYTADGYNISPPLSIEGVDNRTVTFALIVDDPDAGGFTHWIIWNIPASVTSIHENVPTTTWTVDTLGGAVQGLNSFGDVGYSGPAPPGETHTYRFKLYALNTTLTLGPGRYSRADLENAMQGYIIAEATLTGKYG